jgi:integrase
MFLMRAKGEGLNIGHVIQWEGAAIEDSKTAFNNSVKRACLTEVSSDTLKHTAATWLMQSGMDPCRISDCLAASVPTLLKHCGHHNPDHHNEVAAAIGARPGRLQNGLGTRV